MDHEITPSYPEDHFGKGRDSNKSNIKCYYCKEKNHMAKDCLTKRKHEAKQPPSCSGDEKSGKDCLLSLSVNGKREGE